MKEFCRGCDNRGEPDCKRPTLFEIAKLTEELITPLAALATTGTAAALAGNPTSREDVEASKNPFRAHKNEINRRIDECIQGKKLVLEIERTIN